jgi:hypothetical protein
MIWEDPIVAEVRRTRELLAAKFGFDLHAMFSDLRSRQSSVGRRLVSPHRGLSEHLAVAPLSSKSVPDQ